MAEIPNVVYGRLLEAAHFGGYAAERVASEFKWLISDGRWKETGGGFDDIDAFLAAINLAQYRIAIEDRKEIVKLLEAERATQRASAKALGVSVGTINHDLVQNRTSTPDNTNDINDSLGENVQNRTTEWFEAPPQELTRPAQNKVARDERVEQKRAELTRAIEQRSIQPAETTVIDILLADPPWQYDFAETSNRKIENQYPSASTEDICSHIEQSWFPQLSEDSALFLWATAPKLREALRVMSAWNFEYKTHAIWDKEKVGMGYWFRGQHELLLVGTRGNASPPLHELRQSSVFREARRDHSVKPECVYTALEAMFPASILGEVYQRRERPGWKGFRVG